MQYGSPKRPLTDYMHYIPDGRPLHSHRCENVRSYVVRQNDDKEWEGKEMYDDNSGILQRAVT
jgi:hypothetical protein